jgi:hypothetical protein
LIFRRRSLRCTTAIRLDGRRAENAECVGQHDHAWRSMSTNGYHRVSAFDAYADIDWGAPEHRIEPSDPRWEVVGDDPLASTAWYRSLPAEARARVGLYRIVTAMKLGIQFENVLERGLLEFAFNLPNNSDEFRWCHYEVAEELQHGMMFQEFVNRSGVDAIGLPRSLRWVATWIVSLGRRCPALLFAVVMGGEIPIDYVQRRRLSDGGGHPLLTRLIEIHIEEEEDHLVIGRTLLRREVVRLNRCSRTVIALVIPVLLSRIARQMVRPSRTFARVHGMPRSVRRECVHSSPARQCVTDSIAPMRELCAEIGLIGPTARWLWRRLGLSMELRPSDTNIDGAPPPGNP